MAEALQALQDRLAQRAVAEGISVRGLEEIVSVGDEILAPLYTAIILCSVLTAAAALAVPFLIGHATDTVAAAVGGQTPTSTAVRAVVLIAAAVLVAELFNTVVSNIGGWFGDVMSNRMRTILSVRYYDKLLHLPQRWFDGEITGTIRVATHRATALTISRSTSAIGRVSSSHTHRPRRARGRRCPAPRGPRRG